MQTDSNSNQSAFFPSRIHQIRDPKTKEVPDNFEFELKKWTLEAVVLIATDTRLGLLSNDYDKRSAEFFQATKEVFRLLAELEFKPSLWRWFSTSNFKKLMNAFDTITNVSCEVIEEARVRLNSKAKDSTSEDQSVLEKLLQIDPLLAKVMAIDLIFGGVDTVSMIDVMGLKPLTC